MLPLVDVLQQDIEERDEQEKRDVAADETAGNVRDGEKRLDQLFL